MRCILFFLLLISVSGYAQLKSYTIGPKGDTLNKVDNKGLKQDKWVNHFDEIRGEPGYEEEGEYRDNRKEGVWRLYSLQGDLIGVENYRWGNKDGLCQYFGMNGSLKKEEAWRAMNPDRQYDTVVVEDLDKLDQYHTVIVKNEGVAIKHGDWKTYDPATGMITKTETYTLGKLEKPRAGGLMSDSLRTARSKIKPKEVLDFEKKNSGKKKIKVRDGSVSY
jgi:hypothetical protein